MKSAEGRHLELAGSHRGLDPARCRPRCSKAAPGVHPGKRKEPRQFAGFAIHPQLPSNPAFRISSSSGDTLSRKDRCRLGLTPNFTKPSIPARKGNQIARPEGAFQLRQISTSMPDIARAKITEIRCALSTPSAFASASTSSMRVVRTPEPIFKIAGSDAEISSARTL